MLDGGEIARFLHLATRSRFVSTRKDANVIPPWNEAVSAFCPKNNRQKKKNRSAVVGAKVHTDEAAEQDTQERDGGLSVAQARRP